MSQAPDPMLLRAHEFYAQQRFAEAEQCYRTVLQGDPDQLDALQSLVAICLQGKRPQEAEQYLGELVRAYPGEPSFAGHYANALLARGAVDEAVACYQRLLRHDQEPAVSHYNFALLLRRAGKDDAALSEYQQALECGIAEPEQVYSNISVIHTEAHRPELAQAALEQALICSPEYEPALYNLGLLKEETGDWPAAQQSFEQILQRNPHHAGALARLAHGDRQDTSSELGTRLRAALGAADKHPQGKEELLFAIGKVEDDLGNFSQAFSAYEQANQLGLQRLQPYDPVAKELQLAALVESARNMPSSTQQVAPIFICGMFRSGSTLLEQMLAAHPGLTAAGELDFFDRKQDSPRKSGDLSRDALETLALEYIAHLRSLYPDANPSRVTNKRPNNLEYVGLICRAFPNAQVLITERSPLDNALAVYFQPLSAQFNYANRLADIAHYYLQQRHLLESWQTLFPDNVRVVSYESLVNKPQESLEPLLQWLGLSWDPQCLAFYKVANRVRTASVWQVRQPLHQRSIDRWHNYAAELEPLRQMLLQAGVALD